MIEAIVEGDRAALSRAITLVESTRQDHRREAAALIDEALPHTGGSIRLGVSGPPGVGKSTLIEALGLHVVATGLTLAVLAVDPSSARSGGSILGDKTRMPELGRSPEVFIRPSPSGGTLGGIARRTREALLLCEAAGFDLVIVETVGVGQSETAVADVVDLFLLLAAPGGGDDLQGIKRGIMELADVIAVNKADGDLEAAARSTAADFRRAVHLLRPKRPGWTVPVELVSALTGAGLPELWEIVLDLHGKLTGPLLEDLRADQAAAWMWQELHERVGERLSHSGRAGEVEERVRRGELSPPSGAQTLFADLFGTRMA